MRVREESTAATYMVKTSINSSLCIVTLSHKIYDAEKFTKSKLRQYELPLRKYNLLFIA